MSGTAADLHAIGATGDFERLAIPGSNGHRRASLPNRLRAHNLTRQRVRSPALCTAMVDRNEERRRVVTARLLEHIEVSRADIEAAKTRILDNLEGVEGKAEALLDAWLGVHGWQVQPTDFDAVSSFDDIDAFARILSLRAAFAVAINDLLRHGVLLALEPPQAFGYTPKVKTWPNNSGGRLTIRRDHFTILMPAAVMRSPAGQTELQDATLYLDTFKLPGMHPGIRLALSQAVDCFDAGLHLPCLAMLCTAVEGAWIELGRSLGGRIEELAAEPASSLRHKATKICASIKTAGVTNFWKERMQSRSTSRYCCRIRAMRCTSASSRRCRTRMRRRPRCCSARPPTSRPFMRSAQRSPTAHEPHRVRSRSLLVDTRRAFEPSSLGTAAVPWSPLGGQRRAPHR